jgi:hypothetical protein
MPSEDEVLETKLWTFAKYAKELSSCIEYRYLAPNGMEYLLKEVIDLSPELHKKVIIILEQSPYGSEDSAVGTQSGEGAVSGSGPDKLDRPSDTPAGSEVDDRRSSEDRGGGLRFTLDAPDGEEEADADSDPRQGTERVSWSDEIQYRENQRERCIKRMLETSYRTLDAFPEEFDADDEAMVLVGFALRILDSRLSNMRSDQGRRLMIEMNRP